MVSDTDIHKLGDILRDQGRPMKERFRALFTLRNLVCESSIQEISSAFSDPSALLKHELAYCLGQMRDTKAIPVLKEVLGDPKHEPMVRHEAGEALGAIGCTTVSDFLKKYSNDSVVEVAETCQLALERLQWLQSKEANNDEYKSDIFYSVDPSPPSIERNLKLLEQTLLDESKPLFDRYRAIFSLRNINSAESAEVLAKGFRGSSALFRHEIGYVLGQMACESVVEQLASVVKNKKENEMVRHEAAEALGCIATDQAMEVLNAYLKDDQRVVRESCEVALDMCDYENSK